MATNVWLGQFRRLLVVMNIYLPSTMRSSILCASGSPSGGIFETRSVQNRILRMRDPPLFRRDLHILARHGLRNLHGTPKKDFGSGSSHENAEVARGYTPLLGRHIEVGESTGIQFNGNVLRLARLQRDLGESLQFLWRTSDLGVIIGHVNLSNFSPRSGVDVWRGPIVLNLGGLSISRQTVSLKRIVRGGRLAPHVEHRLGYRAQCCVPHEHSEGQAFFCSLPAAVCAFNLSWDTTER